MTKINLREQYPDFYKTDYIIEVPDEVAAVMKEHDRLEAAYRRRTYYHKAHYSLDRGDGIEYAELSKAAKAAGGPEKYVEMLELVSKEAGKMEMLPWLGVAAVGASLLTAATIKVVDYFKSRKKNNETEIEKAKAEIINGIKEYDAAHPDEKGGSEDE